MFPTRRCDTCTPNNKRAWGCEKDIRPYDFFGEELTRCPMRIVLDDPETITEITKHYRWYEKGHFPAQGTWFDQSQVWIEMMDAVSSGHATADKYEHDKRTRREEQIAALKAEEGGGKRTGRT